MRSTGKEEKKQKLLQKEHVVLVERKRRQLLNQRKQGKLLVQQQLQRKNKLRLNKFNLINLRPRTIVRGFFIRKSSLPGRMKACLMRIPSIQTRVENL